MNSDVDYNIEPGYSDATLLPMPECTDAYASRHRGFYLVSVFTGVLISIAIYLFTRKGSWESGTKFGLFFGLFVCAAHIVWRLHPRPRNCLAPDVFYIMFYAAFHLSFLVLWVLGIVGTADQAGVRVFFDTEQYPLVMLIVNLGLLGFLFGYELSAPRRETNILPRYRKVPTAAWPVIGLILMLVALLIHLGFILMVGLRTFMSRGYEVYFYMERFTPYYRLWRIQFHIFAFGFAVYITSIALRHGRLFKGKLGLALFIIYLCLLALEGARTRIVSHGMILLLVRHFVIKPIKLKSVIIIILLGLFLFSSIRLVRDAAAFNVPRMVQIVREAQKTGQSHWYDSLVEMGTSVNTVNLTTMVVPGSEHYWHGKSYIQALVHIIPYMSTVTAPTLGLTPSQWLTFTHFGFFGAGTGYSIAAEGYLNFGLPGVFFQMLVLGVIFRRIYARFIRLGSPVSTITFIIAYGLFMITVRNHTNQLVSPLVNVVVAAYLLKSIFVEETLPIGYEHEEPVLYEQQDHEIAPVYE